MLTNLDNNLQKMPINDQIYLCKFNKKVMDILEKFVLIMKSTKIEIKELLIYKVKCTLCQGQFKKRYF